MTWFVKLIIGIGLVSLGIIALGKETAAPKDPAALPEKAQIFHYPVSDNTFGVTNCYIIDSGNGQAIIIDPADALTLLDAEVAIDPATGKFANITPDEKKKFRPAEGNYVIDPADGTKKIIYERYRANGIHGPRIVKTLQERKLKLKAIILTHGHMDHLGSIGYLKEKTGAQIMMHEGDVRQGYPKDAYRVDGCLTKVDRVLKDGDLITIDGMTLQVIHTPGHSPGGMCLYSRFQGKPVLFSGDTLLRYFPAFVDADGSYFDKLTYRDTGRTNFKDGSGDTALLYKSLREKLFVLPDDTCVYPGHNEPTTIGEEKRYSPANHNPPVIVPLDE